MSDFKMRVIEDGSKFELEVTNGPLTMGAVELEDFIRALGLLRATMKPSAPVKPAPGIRFTSTPSTHLHVMVDVIPTRLRLFLTHPGLGWVWILLTRQQAEETRAQIQAMILNMPTMQ
jgi:hypothetical protein